MLFITSALSDRCTVYFHHDPQLRRGHMLECNTSWRVMQCVVCPAQTKFWWPKMVNLTKTRNFNGTIRFIGSNRVEKYSPQIYHVTLIFYVSHPKYVL